MERDELAKKVAFRREAGMSQEGREAMNSFLSKQEDWYMTCKKCGEKITGTIDRVKDHGKICK